MADGYGNIYPDSANYIDNGNGYYDEKLEQTTRTDILKLILYDLNSAISPRDARLIAIQAALEEFDHNDEALHDEELELRADHILLQKLTYAMSINMSSDEVGYITSALEAVYRGGRGRLAQSFHEICDALMPLFVEMIRPPNGWTPSKLAEQLSQQHHHQQQSLLGGSPRNSVRASSMIDNADERSFAQSLASLGATSRVSKDQSVQHDFQRSHGSFQQPTYYGDYDEESAESVEIPSGTGEYMEQMKRMSSTATGTSGRGDGDESTMGGVGVPPAGTEYFDEMNRRTSGGEYSTATGTESKVDSTGNDSALVIDKRLSSFGVETTDSTGNGQALVPVTHELVSADSVGSGPQVDIRNELEDAQEMMKRMSVAHSEAGEESLNRSPAVSHDSYEDFVAKEKEKMEGLRESTNSYDDFLENEKAKAESLGSAEDDGASFGSSAYSRRSSEPPPQDQGSYQASQEYEEEGYDDNKDERSATGGSESSPPSHQEEDSQVPYNDDDTNRSSFRSEVNSEGLDEAPAVQPFDDDEEDQVPQDDYAEQPEEEVPAVESYDDYAEEEEEEGEDQAPAIQPYDSEEGYDDHAVGEDEAPMVQPFDDEDDYEDDQEFDNRSEEQEGSEDGAMPLRGGGDEIEDVTAQYATDSQYNPFSDPAEYDDAQSGSGYNQGGLAASMTYPQKDEYSEYSGAGGGGYNEQGGRFPMSGDQSQASYGQGSGMDYTQEQQQHERKFSQTSGYGGDEDPVRRMSVLSDDEWGGLEQSDRDPSTKGGQSYGDPSTMGGQSRDPSSIGQSLPPSKNPDDFMASMNEFVIEDEVTEAEEKYSDFPTGNNETANNAPPNDNHDDIFQFQDHSKPRSEQDYFNYSDPVEGTVCSLAVRKVIKILRYFSRVLSAMEPLAQMNGLVDALLYHMTKKPLTTDYDDEIACRVDAIAVIVNLACAEENKIMLVYHPGLLDAVINIANHDPIDEAREHAAIVLMNLAYAEENKVRAII